MLLYGAVLAAGTLLLAGVTHGQRLRALSSDVLSLLTAAGFLALGLWLGLVVLRPASPPSGNPAAADSLGLSPREREVLRALAAGHSNKEIARLLSVSPNTVKTHLTRLFTKLGASNRTAAVSRARDLGLIG
ncbi:MAG: helix-turn-helix transcriptional regulator [Alphaproteobacteria bacterium PA4]|nr:MAG: helix-turn-helix transcriptional regulator [Alphaproteobacteria bacterium PA4]